MLLSESQRKTSAGGWEKAGCQGGWEDSVSLCTVMVDTRHYPRLYLTQHQLGGIPGVDDGRCVTDMSLQNSHSSRCSPLVGILERSGCGGGMKGRQCAFLSSFFPQT